MALINWYPGHIAKAQKRLKELLKLCDAVIEVLDARAPRSTRLEQGLVGEKPRILVYSKGDLADVASTRAWLAADRAAGFTAVAVNGQSGEGLAQLKKALVPVGDAVRRKMAARGRLPRAARIMVVGAPNVGKSSLINRLAGRRAAHAADKAGVTRAPQWIRLGKDLELLDTPGLIPPKLEDPDLALRLALVGGVSAEAFDPVEVARAALALLADQVPDAAARAGADLEAFALARGLLASGGLPDLERSARTLLSDLRGGALGAVTLDRPPGALGQEPPGERVEASPPP